MTTTDLDALYHYTDSAGLLGILGDPTSFQGVEKTANRKFTRDTRFGVLWATDARYLNDSQEIDFAIPTLVRCLEAQADAIDRTPVVAERLRELAGDVREKRFEMTWHQDAKKAIPYVACFCESPDLLSQWRGYGDGGGGYAIGFRREILPIFSQLTASFLDSYPQFALKQMLREPKKVCYQPEDAAAMMEDLASEIASNLEEWATEDKEISWPDVPRLTCLGKLAQMKHPAFAEEAERRFIVNDFGLAGENLEFRAGRLGLIPYMKLHFPINYQGKSAISEIVIGPGGDRDLRKEALEGLLRKIGSTQTEVRLSDAPFRG